MPKYFLVLTENNNQRKQCVALGSRHFVIQPEAIMMFVTEIIAVFDELYGETMPLDNVIDVLTKFYDIGGMTPDANEEDIPSFIDSFDDETTEFAKIENAYNAIRYAKPVSHLGLQMYLTIRSYLNGNGGEFTDDDLADAIDKLADEMEGE
ncbi:hypothetical protein [Limosilactobacillus mucosae]|nr:hypothetical protein [Limosilactobacillus mucosae]